MVQNRAGAFIKADLKSLTAAAAEALIDFPRHAFPSVTDAPGKDSYPICGMVWAVLYQDQPPARGRQVVDFLQWVTHEGQRECASLYYARLPESVLPVVEKQLHRVRTGD
jgi:ABC-type phosphate transport system substrate-binding protein